MAEKKLNLLQFAAREIEVRRQRFKLSEFDRQPERG